MLDSKAATGLHPTPYLRNANVRWHQFELGDLAVMDIRPEELARVTLRPGDVVVCEGGEPGRAAVWCSQEPAAIQKALHRVRPGQRLVSAFLTYYLDYLASTGVLAKFFTGTTIKHLPKEKLAALAVPLPSVSEQHLIVDMLDAQLSRLDFALAALLEANRKAEQFRKAFLRDTFIGALDKSESLESLLSTSIGGIWGEVPGQCDVDVYVLRVTELRPHGVLDPSTAALRSVSTSQLASRQLQVGDLLLEKSGGGPNTPVGRVGLVVEVAPKSVCSNFMQLMRPDPAKVLSEYLHLYLSHLHNIGGTARFQTATTNIRNIKASEYLKLKVPVPGLDEQRAIVSKASKQLGEIAGTVRRTSVVTNKAHQLRRSLLHAAFCGQLTRTWREQHDG